MKRYYLFASAFVRLTTYVVQAHVRVFALELASKLLVLSTTELSENSNAGENGLSRDSTSILLDILFSRCSDKVGLGIS
jgi:hypothetical protein